MTSKLIYLMLLKFVAEDKLLKSVVSSGLSFTFKVACYVCVVNKPFIIYNYGI